MSFFLYPKKELNWWISNWKESKEFRRQLLVVVLGFGVAGVLWAWHCYDWATHNSEFFTNPFSIILGAFELSILSALSLGFAFFKNNKKKFFLLFLLSIPVWLISFLLPAIFTEWIAIVGSTASIIYIGFYYLFKIDISKLFYLKPSLGVTQIWPEFFLTFLLISLFYLFFFPNVSKKRFLFLPPLWVALSSILSPIISNLLGFYLFHSLLLSYLLTFLLTSLTFAFSLFREIKRV